MPAKNRCNTCDQLGSELLQLAYEHLKAEQRLMEATLVSRDPVLTSAAAMAIPVILRKRGELLGSIISAWNTGLSRRRPSLRHCFRPSAANPANEPRTSEGSARPAPYSCALQPGEREAQDPAEVSYRNWRLYVALENF